MQYCSMLYSNVTVVGAHNSYTASNTNLAANQDYGGAQPNASTRRDYSMSDGVDT